MQYMIYVTLSIAVIALVVSLSTARTTIGTLADFAGLMADAFEEMVANVTTK